MTRVEEAQELLLVFKDAQARYGSDLEAMLAVLGARDFIVRFETPADIASYCALAIESATRMGYPINELDIRRCVGVAHQVAQDAGMTLIDLRASDRRRTLVRHKAMWACREERHTLTTIGAVLGRDHTTVLSGIGAHECRRTSASVDAAVGSAA